jgi:mono/diheme cytochrome c family protein
MRTRISPGALGAAVLIALFGLTAGATLATAQNARGGGASAADSTYYSTYHAVPRDTVSPAVYQGWKQYMLNCARCHGDYGVGTSFAPALVESVKPAGTIPTPELFIQTVCAGRMDKGMPAWCALGLDMAAMQEIHAYLVERASGKVGLGRPAMRE